MDFISSAFAAFIGAFFAIYLKNLFEENKHIIRIHEETHSLLTKAYLSISKHCFSRCNGVIDFDPPDQDSVKTALNDFFIKRYIQYTGHYAPQLQKHIDELRTMYNDIDETLPPMTPFEDSPKLGSLFEKIQRMCEDEVCKRRSQARLKRLWQTFSRTFTTNIVP